MIINGSSSSSSRAEQCDKLEEVSDVGVPNVGLKAAKGAVRG